MSTVIILHREFSQHEWTEVYYGYRCECGAFMAFGTAPWEEHEEDLQETASGD